MENWSLQRKRQAKSVLSSGWLLYSLMRFSMGRQKLCEYELIGMKKYAHWPISTNSRRSVVIALRCIHELKLSD